MGATLVVVVLALVLVDTPVTALVRYALYLVLGVIVPGMLVHRALRGRPDDVVADVSIGAATGVFLGLVGWALFMVIGIQQFLAVWPILIIAVFALTPRLRRNWDLSAYPQRVGWAGWLLAAAIAFYAVWLTASHLRHYPIPPAPNFYYADIYWHIANAAELMRSLPPEVPSVAGRTLRYHYFVNAHIGTSHVMSGVDLTLTYVRLWEIPLVAVICGLIFSLTRKITGRAWAGALAAFLLVAPLQIQPWGWKDVRSSFALTEGSPSQVLAVLFLLLASYVLVDIVRGKHISKGSWALLAIALICAPGAKPSVIPVLLAGLGLVLVIKVFRRERIKPVLAAMGMAVVAVLALSPLVAQSAIGSGIKLFGILYFDRTWTTYVNEYAYPGTGPKIIPGLDQPGALTVALLLMAALLLQYAWALTGLALLRRKIIGDPVVVFLAGGFVAGVGVVLIVDHPGASEIYFGRTAAPFGIILMVWGLAVSLEAARERMSRRAVAMVAVGAAATGAVISWATVRSADGAQPPRERYAEALAAPFIALALGLAIALAAWWLARSTFARTLRGAGVAAACALTLGLFATQGPWQTTRMTASALGGAPVAALPAYHVTTNEVLAARWLRDNAPADDLSATNLHCVEKKTEPRCEGRAYWLPALSEHRYLVLSWADTEENLSQVGEHTGGWSTYPFDEPELLALNDRAFTDPTPETIAELRDKHQVRWLFADLAAGPVSPELERLATLRYSNDDARIYELTK